MLTSLAISVLEPYRLLAQGPQTADRSVMVVPAVMSFNGLGQALARREWFVALTQTAVVLSNLTPALLSGVPFSPTQTWETHLICGWTSIGFLGFMVLVLVYGAVFVRYPRMPLDPSSLAGRIYYVCDSNMTRDFQGTSLLSEKEFTREVRSPRRFTFGKMIGTSGGQRIGVDYEHQRFDDWRREMDSRDGESFESDRAPRRVKYAV